MIRKTALCLLAAGLLALPACSNVKRDLGVGRNSPDEFAVVKRAPLSLPPDYTLRPPGTESPPSASEAKEIARTIVLGAPQQEAPAASGEEALLEKMGAKDADPSVRAAIDRDNGILSVQNRSVRDKLIFWSRPDDDATPQNLPKSEVDAKAEAERLKKNAAEGKPANSGDVPVIEKKKSTIERIFD